MSNNKRRVFSAAISIIMSITFAFSTVNVYADDVVESASETTEISEVSEVSEASESLGAAEESSAFETEELNTNVISEIQSESQDAAGTEDNSSDVQSGIEAASQEATATVTDVNADETQMDISVSNFSPSESGTLYAAVWSEENGQDDIIWYVMSASDDGNYHVTVYPASHKSSGRYYAHIYYNTSSGSQLVAEETFTIDGGSCSSITVEAADNSSGTCTVKITGASSASGVKNILVPVWSQSDQSDINWYNAVLKEDGNYYAYIDISNHNYNFGKYHIHVYMTNNNDVFTYIGDSEVTFEQTYGNVSAQEQGEGYLLTAEGFSVPGTIKNAYFAVWSRENGQDDIKWNSAVYDQTAKTLTGEAKAEDIKSSGTVYVHAYVELNTGKMICVGTYEFEYTPVSCESISVADIDNTNGTCEIVIKGISSVNGINSVIVPIWSQPDQSDIVWYTAEKQNDGSYTVKMDIEEHNLNRGLYYIHVYVSDSSGNMLFVGNTNVEFTVNDENFIAVSSNYNAGTFRVNIDGDHIGSETEKIVIPVWSKGNQSDIVWYEAEKNSSGNYTLNTSIAKHNYNLGIYYIHIYTVDSAGTYTKIGEKTVDFSFTSGSLSCTTSDYRYFDEELSSISMPGTIKKVLFAVWSEEDGQDDIVWYTTSGSKGSGYSAEIDINNHQTEGKYYVHAYAEQSNGNMIFVGSTEFTVSMSVEGTVSAVEADSNGKYDITIELSNITGDIDYLLVPVWSKSDQSDIIWYTAESSGGNSYSVTIDTRDHSYSGTYYIHVYAVFTNGIMHLATGTNHYFEDELLITSADGSSARRIIYRNAAVSSVSFAVWTSADGQDDIIWYTASNDGSGNFYADVSAAQHGNGIYNVHVYSGDTFLCADTFSIIDYVEWAIRTAADDSIGYSQTYRCLNPDVDCSSFVYYALYYNGFLGSLSSYPFYTGSQISYMQRCGFTVLDYTSEADLQPGDVLWYRNGSQGHTEIYIGDGLMVGAHDSVVNGIDYSQGGDQTGDEVSIRAFSDKGWTKVLRIYS